MIQIEIKHLQLVSTIAKTRNLTRAAAMLHISCPLPVISCGSWRLRSLSNAFLLGHFRCREFVGEI